MPDAETTLVESIVTWLTVAAAWIGCVVSLLVYHRDKPRVVLSAWLGLEEEIEVPLSTGIKKETYQEVFLTIINDGRGLTTAHEFMLVYYSSWFARLLRRPTHEQGVLRLGVYELELVAGKREHLGGRVPDFFMQMAREKGCLYGQVLYGANRKAKCRIAMDREESGATK